MENELAGVELTETPPESDEPRVPFAAKRVDQMTVTELRAVPHRAWTQDIGPFSSLVIVPYYGKKRYLHESGYRKMNFVAVDAQGYPTWRMGGNSDVLHIDGIGGFGANWSDARAPEDLRLNFVVPAGWTIDCLPRSGCIRLWPFNGRAMIADGVDVSSFEIWSSVADWRRNEAKESIAKQRAKYQENNNG